MTTATSNKLPTWRRALNVLGVVALVGLVVWFVVYAIDARDEADRVRQGFRDTASGR